MNARVATLFFQNLSRFERPEPNGNRRIPGWLETLRRSAFQWISERGFPTNKDEIWKYTKLAPILDVAFARAERETSHRLSSRAIDQLVDDLGGPRLVVVNGFFAPELSSLKNLPAAVKVTSLAWALAEDDGVLEPLLSRPFREHPSAFTALSAAFAEDGVLVQIPAHENTRPRCRNTG